MAVTGGDGLSKSDKLDDNRRAVSQLWEMKRWFTWWRGWWSEICVKTQLKLMVTVTRYGLLVMAMVASQPEDVFTRNRWDAPHNFHVSPSIRYQSKGREGHSSLKCYRSLPPYNWVQIYSHWFKCRLSSGTMWMANSITRIYVITILNRQFISFTIKSINSRISSTALFIGGQHHHHLLLRDSSFPGHFMDHPVGSL